MDDDEIHIAVEKNIQKEKANILWTAANFARATIVLVHVHWPRKWMHFMGTLVLYKFADEKEKEKHRREQKGKMVEMLSEYKSLCGTRKVRAHYLVWEDIPTGVVKMIERLKVKRIVFGSRKMSEQLLIRTGCQVWLVDNGKHISTSYELMDGITIECSNSHLEHSRSTGDGGNPVFELGDQSDSYTTAPSDLEAETLTGEDLEERIAYQKEVENFEEEDADKCGEIRICRNVTKEAEKLRVKIDRSIHPELQIPDHIVHFLVSSIEKATNNFYSRIGGGGYGPVYEGKVGGIPVAIKLLKPDGEQGYREYKQEVAVLSRTKHPHIVKLMGVCPESCGLVYEHLPNGTLLEGVSSKCLSWEECVRILAEQRSALAYLHCNRPHAIIHADLKLSNILLDAGNVSRLGDFGMARLVHMKSLEEETIRRVTTPMGTRWYMDPVFLTSCELTTGSDVYSFGVVILKVLTGQVGVSMVEVAERVREAVKANAVHRVLDPSAGSWPWAKKHAKGLLRLALQCCSLERERRPAITAGEWRQLDSLQAMANKSRAEPRD